MDVRSVGFPATAATGDPLDIDVEVTVGGCSRFKRFEAARAPSRLTLRAVGTRTLNVPCKASIDWEHRGYTGSGTPAHTGPFEVSVNGRSWGAVEVH